MLRVYFFRIGAQVEPCREDRLALERPADVAGDLRLLELDGDAAWAAQRCWSLDEQLASFLTGRMPSIAPKLSGSIIRLIRAVMVAQAVPK